MKKSVLFILLSILALSSCSKNQKNTAENTIEKKSAPRIRKNAQAQVQDDYIFSANQNSIIEIGYDGSLVFLTDKKSEKQIVFDCLFNNGGNNREDLLLIFYNARKSWKNKDEAEYYGKTASDNLFEIAEINSDEIKTEYDMHFRKELKKYYLNYQKVWSHFHK